MAEFARSLQENLLTLICYDEERAKIIRGVIEAELFEGPYQEIIRRAYAYIDRYKKPPGDHIADELEDILLGSDNRRARAFSTILVSLREARVGVNPDYAMSKLMVFLRAQRQKAAILAAADELEAGGEDAAEKVDEIVSAMLKQQEKTFDPGVFMHESKKVLAFFDEVVDAFPTGLAELDRRNLGPLRKGLHLFIGLAKRGKTWWLINLAKQAALQHLKVVHVSLEMSEDHMARRYVQALFALPKVAGDYRRVRFQFDDSDRLVLDFKTETPAFSLADGRARSRLILKIRRLERLLRRICIKEFPTGKLTVRQLESYLDYLDASFGFQADLLIVDYPELMTLNSHDLRLSISQLYKDLRGLGVQRNMAVAVVSQSNREGLLKSLVTEGNASEDYSKIATADTVITYSQTNQERKYGLARLFVSNARHEEDKITFLISQNYAMGQFARDAIPLDANYGLALEELGGQDQAEDDDS